MFKTIIFILMLSISVEILSEEINHRLKSIQLSSKSGTLYYDENYLEDLPFGVSFIDTPLYQCVLVKEEWYDNNSQKDYKLKFVTCKIKPDAQERIDDARVSAENIETRLEFERKYEYEY